MLKLAADLSDNYEYALVWGGQSNSRPWGSKAEGFAEAAELDLEDNGIEITGVVITADNRTGNNARITVGTTLTGGVWQGAQIRFFRASGGTGPGLFKHYTDPLGGLAIVDFNSATELRVDWVNPIVQEDGTAFTGTCKAYLTFADDKWKTYPNVRILTPYQPEGELQGVGTQTVDYPSTATTKLGAPGYTVPVGVASFEDLGLFLPFSFLEGIDSYGISDDADSAYGTNGARTTLAAWDKGLAIFNAVPISTPWNALAGGYVYVEWLYDTLGANTPKRSWAKLTGNTRTAIAGRDSLIIDSNGWQGDGTPQLWSSSVGTDTNATIAAGAPHVTASAGTPFAAVLAGDLVVVTDATGEHIGIVASVGGGGATITLDAAGWMGGTPASGANAVVVYHNSSYSLVTLMEAWVPHFNNSPHSYLGPGFRYPNNDMMPCAFSMSSNNSVVAITGTGATIAGTPIVTDGTKSWTPNQYVGWIVTCSTSWAYVTGNTKTELYGAWVGGTPASPNSYSMTNALGTGARIHNRPRGIIPNAYGDRFGSLLNFASWMSAALGKRVNVIHLGINSAPIFQLTTSNTFGFRGQIGWWDWHKHLSWSPSQVDGHAQRLKKLITAIAPNALLAEGNTKPLKVLAFCWLQGEGDALEKSARHVYGRSLQAFVSWLRDVVDDAGMNPYGAGAKVPWVQPKITHVPYELTGTFTYYNQLSGATFTLTLSGDDEGWVNSAIVEFCITDGFADFIVNDDLTKLGDTSLTNGIDPLHYDGKGEVHVGERMAQAVGTLIEKALSYGSICLQRPLTRIVTICNMALAHIGETQITSLDDGTTQANLCRQFFPEARDALLQSRQWGFALRRVELEEINAPPPGFSSSGPLYDQYAHCYAVPAEALNAFAVLPPSPDSDYTQLGAEAGEELLIGGPAPTLYAIETSPTSGGRILFTNQADAVLRYVARVTDAEAFSPLFATTLSWYLASMLASSIIKGDAGEAVSQRCLQKAGGYARMAASSDGNQRSIKLQHLPDHLKNR